MLSLLAQAAPDADFNIAEEAETQGLPGADVKLYGDADRGFGSFIGGILGMAMVLAALLVLIYLMWGAIEWISAGGDKSKIEKARNRMTQAVIGIIVLASTLAIFNVLQRFLGISVINFSGITQSVGILTGTGSAGSGAVRSGGTGAGGAGTGTAAPGGGKR